VRLRWLVGLLWLAVLWGLGSPVAPLTAVPLSGKSLRELAHLAQAARDDRHIRPGNPAYIVGGLDHCDDRTWPLLDRPTQSRRQVARRRSALPGRQSRTRTCKLVTGRDGGLAPDQVCICITVTASLSRKQSMQNRHHGRRTTWAPLAMTQNPAAFPHLQHDFMVPFACDHGLRRSPRRGYDPGFAPVLLRREAMPQNLPAF